MVKLGKEFTVEKITFDELEKAGYVSVTDYCRYLVTKEKDIPNRIEVYRNEMLCLTVNDVPLAATLEPSGTGWNKYVVGNNQKARRSVDRARGCV